MMGPVVGRPAMSELIQHVPILQLHPILDLVEVTLEGEVVDAQERTGSTAGGPTGNQRPQPWGKGRVQEEAAVAEADLGSSLPLARKEVYGGELVRARRRSHISAQNGEHLSGPEVARKHEGPCVHSRRHLFNLLFLVWIPEISCKVSWTGAAAVGQFCDAAAVGQFCDAAAARVRP